MAAPRYLDLQHSEAILLQVEANLQHLQDSRTPTLLDGHLPIDERQRAPRILLQIIADMLQVTLGLQQNKDHAQQNKIYSQHLKAEMLQILRSRRSAPGHLQHNSHDLQQIAGHLQ